MFIVPHRSAIQNQTSSEKVPYKPFEAHFQKTSKYKCSFHFISFCHRFKMKNTNIAKFICFYHLKDDETIVKIPYVKPYYTVRRDRIKVLDFLDWLKKNHKSKTKKNKRNIRENEEKNDDTETVFKMNPEDLDMEDCNDINFMMEELDIIDSMDQ